MNLKNFDVVLDAQATKDLKKLKQTHNLILPKLVKAIDLLGVNPYQGKSLAGNKKGCYSLRVGDFRIIYEVYPLQKIIHIIRVGHRKEIYR